jgi:hypothetical protein
MKAALISLLLVLTPIAAVASDPVGELQLKMKSGQSKLEFEKDHGYLVSLLKALKVPISSQTLVFSKTSLQSERISPKTPRAIYFNDDVYVAWVQGSGLIEIMSTDPQKGSIFYVLSQERNDHPEFERSTGHECSVCHYVSEAAPKFVPRLLVSSVIPDATGNVDGTFPIETTDQSPMKERWGGWVRHRHAWQSTPRGQYRARQAGIAFQRTSFSGFRQIGECPGSENFFRHHAISDSTQ